MRDPMFHAARQLVRAVNGETPEAPHPDLLPGSWEEDLRGQERGGSGNHGWLGHTLQFARDLAKDAPRVRPSHRYLAFRLEWELKHGLGAHEQLSPTYFGIHLACVVVVECLAREHALHELVRLAGQWLDRVLALEALTSIRDGSTVKPLGPGMRADHRSVTEGRRVEGAIVARQVGMSPSFEAGDATFWGPLLAAAQGVPRVEREDTRFLFHNKRPPWWPGEIQGARLLVPMKFMSWANGGWMAWIPESRGGQDPPLMAGGVIDGEHVYLWPFVGEDPPEGGWRAEAHMVQGTRPILLADWYRKGEEYAADQEILERGYDSTTIGAAEPTEPEEPDPTEPTDPWPDPEPGDRAQLLRHCYALIGQALGLRPGDQHDHVEAIHRLSGRLLVRKTR